MAEYIEREAVKAAVKKRLGTMDLFESRFNADIDAVPVTRCKNCDWCEPYGDYFFCEKLAIVCTLDDFCSYGERKDGDA